MTREEILSDAKKIYLSSKNEKRRRFIKELDKLRINPLTSNELYQRIKGKKKPKPLQYSK